MTTRIVELLAAAQPVRGKPGGPVAGAWEADGTVFVNPAQVVAIRPRWADDSDEWTHCDVFMSSGAVFPVAMAGEEIAGLLADEEV